MLYLDDEKIAQREQFVPGLRVLLDNDASTKIFRQAFQQLHVQVATCNYLRYKIGTSCVASFTLQTSIGQLWAHAIAYRGDATDKLAKAQQKATSYHNAKVVLAEHSLVLNLFPFDDGLPSLEFLTNNSPSNPFLKKLAPHEEGLHSALVTNLRYKPRRRYVGRVDFDDIPRAILKMHSDSEYQRARRATKSLHPFAGITKADVLSHSDRHRAILLKWVPGRSLTEYLLNCEDNLLTTFENVGGLLKELHSHPRLKLPRFSKDEYFTLLMGIPRELRMLCPELAKQSQTVVDKTAQMLADLNRPCTSLHGDLSCDQIIVGEGVSFIDFDNASLGHAEQDLGNLLANLVKFSINKRLSDDVVDAMFEALLREYKKLGGEIDDNATYLYSAISLLGLIQEPFRVRQRDWRENSELLLEKAGKCLGLASSHNCGIYCTPPAPNSSLPEILELKSDSSMMNSLAAVDLSQARQHLLPLLKKELQDDSLELRSLRLVRHKPGKRCLVEYKCESRQSNRIFSVLGKAYSKPKHLQNHRIQLALWGAGFDDRSSTQVFVPRPLGVLNEWRMFFQEKVIGKDGWATIADNPEMSANNLLNAIQNLQDSQILTVRQHTVVDEIEHLEKCLVKTRLVFPQLRSRIESLMNRCKQLSHAIPDSVFVPTHRDFYPDQVIFTSQGLCLIDFDLFCLSDPSLDLGNFNGHLIERRLREPEFGAIANNCRDQFMAHYIRSDRLLQWKTVEAFTTLTLARHVYLSTLFSERVKYTDIILKECESRLDTQLSDSYWANSRQLSFA